MFKINGELIFTSKELGKLTIYSSEESFAISHMNRSHLDQTKQIVEKSNVCEKEEKPKSDQIEKITLLSTQSPEQRSVKRKL
jgi:hypothetical protein